MGIGGRLNLNYLNIFLDKLMLFFRRYLQLINTRFRPLWLQGCLVLALDPPTPTYRDKDGQARFKGAVEAQGGDCEKDRSRKEESCYQLNQIVL